MVVGIWIGYKLKDNIKSPQAFFDMPQTNQLQEVVEILSKKYVDSLNIDSLKIKAINNLLYQLDPYSAYIPANKLQDSNNELAGNFEGIGVEFQIIRDTANILQVFENGPAQNAGLQIGDKLLKIDNITTTGSNILPEKIKQQLQAQKNQTAQLTILRNNKNLTISIKKGFIPIKTIDAAYKLDSITGYIRINRFAETTYIEFMQALENLMHSNIKELVLDLRDNGGGLLSQAVDIANEFLNDDDLVVSVQGSKVAHTEYRCKRNGSFSKGKLKILVNESTTSAAEIVAGALQDLDRAIIIGQNSYGKGLVQEQYTLTDGSALRLTIAKYYLPTGRNIQKPYINAKDSLNKKSFKTPAGHIVYGNNGIMPDVVVMIDSTLNNSLGKTLIEKNIIHKFAYEYFIANRKTIETYKTSTNFAKQYTLSTLAWNNFLTYAKQNNVEINNISFSIQTVILHRIKALLARFIWGNEGFYEVYNSNDTFLQKALEIVK